MPQANNSHAALRLLTDPPQAGAMNMALDEALLEHIGQGSSPPTLRLYRWSPPTISLGYFQAYEEYESLPPPAGELAVVRRLTGGGAILHDLELTYSLTLPNEHLLLSDGPTALYGKAHAVFVRALAALGVEAVPRGECDEDSVRRGPFFCFSRQHRDDLVLGSGKLAGSAQRRTRTAVLQHGSVILGSRFEQQECAPAGLEVSDERIRQLTAAICTEFVKSTELTLQPGQWSDAEIARAAELRAKYESDEWNRLR
ncbi:MAG: lipoate--protein ligase family protein [Phycisphaerales bacterium]|nr:MAG: lipoate--protein ligase family protein [Phycisphaerales bacterium]